MKHRTLICLAFVMVFVLACDLPGIVHEITRSDSETPVGQSSAQTANGTGLGQQTPTGRSPTQAANGTGPGAQTPAGQSPTQTANAIGPGALTPTGQSPTQTANDKGPGPQTLDASDPDLLKQHTSSVSAYDQDLYEGFDKSGAPYKLSYDRFHMEQIVPNWGYYSHISVIRNGKADPAKESEGGQLNGKNFSINTGKCGVSADKGTHTPSGSFLVSMQDISGKLNRVENGVTINGVLTDRYEIQPTNLRWRSRAVEFRPSSLYRAREGGYLVSFVYTVLDQHDSSRALEKDFDPSKPVLITLRHDLTYYAPGTSFIQLPALCAGK